LSYPIVRRTKESSTKNEVRSLQGVQERKTRRKIVDGREAHGVETQIFFNGFGKVSSDDVGKNPHLASAVEGGERTSGARDVAKKTS